MEHEQMRGRLLAVSDIHGHAEGLLLLLRQANYSPARDRLILLGDFIDADAEDWTALHAVEALVAQGAVALPGNQELLLLERSAAAPAWLAKLPFYHIEGGFLFVHAGLRPHVPLHLQHASDFTGIRDAFWRRTPDCGFTVVFGHTPTFKLGAKPGSPWLAPGRIGIDCGAKHGRRLALVDLTGAVHYSCSTAPYALYGDVRVQQLI